MNRYQKLGWNTLVIGLGSMGSKFMIFLLVPFYTFYLLPAQYGKADIIMMTMSILIPVVSLSIADGVFRYTMEKVSKQQVFSSACAILLVAGLVLLLLIPMLKTIPMIQDYYWVFLILLIVQLWNTLFQQQARANGKLILYSGLVFSCPLFCLLRTSCS
ncbi:hypothetical protein HBP99_17280 [Listeria booriae]|uniref:hypothetical protein n=1 Tax=Listeria booriae TaxID=1552123 RepID=UPI0016233513|nr:hypothetical protein [Listeria booriae]MBC2370355.1 hypothetical protein [Listeria booriae]